MTTKNSPNVIDEFRGEYRWLSNFHLSPVRLFLRDFPSVEHAYQAGKSASPRDWDEMLKMKTCSQAKELGQRLILREDWEDIKVGLMTYLVRKKFKTDPILEQKLLDTKEAVLIEGNDWNDIFWGMCNGYGENNLGKILMRVRAEIKEDNDLGFSR